MKQLLSLLLLILSFNSSFAQFISKNEYSFYYKEIIRAEETYFLKNKPIEALAIYITVFNKYDFVFSNDAFIALQIAVKENLPYQLFLEKGIANGLDIKMIHSCKFLKEKIDTSKNEFKELFIRNREQYLKKINYNYRYQIYKIYLNDQINKNKKNYYDILPFDIEQTVGLIKKFGFPSEKILGANSYDIFNAKGTPEFDITFLEKQYGITEKKDTKYRSSNESNTFDIIFPILVHHPCFFQFNEDLIWQEVLKGNLHPREFGMINDNQFRFLAEKCFNTFNCEINYVKKYFHLNCFINLLKQYTSVEINKFRSEIFVGSIELDLAKKEKVKNEKFILTQIGFFWCR